MTQHRQLAAIMFTDIEGYTALMQRDEKEAVQLRDRHRNTFEATTEAYNGKIIQYFGDGTLSTFKSTVEAVNCAIEIQEAFRQDPAIPVRIGIHVGDIIQSKDDIIGDAVNLASRIESCAIPNSILVSDKVHDQLRSHPEIKAKFIDAFEFVNVEHAVPVFAIANEGLSIPKREHIKGKLKKAPRPSRKRSIIKYVGFAVILLLLLALANKIGLYDIKFTQNTNSIAVLPFDNLSFDNDAVIFRDGVTQDILTRLAKVKDLHVISKTSVIGYAETEKKVSQIAKELGVSYILTGTIQKAGEQVRISTQLVEASSDKNIWVDKYDVTITDIFKVQSEVSSKIVDALKITLTADEQSRIAKVTEYDLEAYKYYLQGLNEADKRELESILKSIDLFKKAIEIEPEYGEAYAEIANSIYLQTYYGDIGHVEAGKEARAYLDQAEKIDPNISRIYSVRGLIYNIEGDWSLAKASFEKAIALAPNDKTARQQYANLFYYSKDYEQQLEQAQIAYSLDPLSFVTANSYFTALLTNKKYTQAEDLIKKIEAEGINNNQSVIHRSYFRLYMDLRDYEKVIYHTEKIVDEYSIFNRFLGYCYGKVGDTVGAKRMIADIYERTPEIYKSHQLAVVYSGLQQTDSVLFHLDTIRNKRTDLLSRDLGTFFEYLKDDPGFNERLKQHGLK